MSYDLNRQQTAAAYGSDIDAGLQSFMQRVFNTMGVALVVTGFTAFGISSSEALMQAIFGTQLRWVAVFAPLAYLILGFTPRRIASMSAGAVKMHLMIFSAVMGLSMAAIFSIFSTESIARVFFITAATFAATSLYGYTTKRNLTNMGAFMMMGAIGIFIAMIVNLFIESSMIHFVVSVLGVIVFTGLTAWDVQNLKETYRYASGHEANDKLAYMGALSLYINFINLFQFLLSLAGSRE